MKPYDIQSNRMRPRKNVIRRFERLCLFLAENTSDYCVKTFGGLSKEQLDKMLFGRNDFTPEIPSLTSLLRFGEQLWDNLI